MAGERVRYICPICDQELKFGKHFCWNCKSRVEEPWRYTGGHLPNEGHEAGCHPAQTFMQPRSGPAHTGRTHGGRSLAGKNNTSKQYTYNRPGQAPNTARTEPSCANRPAAGAPYAHPGAGSYGGSGTYSGANTPRRKNTGVGTLILVVFVFWFIIQVIAGLLFRF